MDIQEIESKFEELLLAHPDFDESLLQKDEDGCYEDFDINSMYQMFEAGTEVGEKWQAAKAQTVPEGFVLVEKDLIQSIHQSCNNALDINDRDIYKGLCMAIIDDAEAMIEAQEQSND